MLVNRWLDTDQGKFLAQRPTSLDRYAD